MKIAKSIIIIVLDILIFLLILWFVLGYLNFGKISNNEEPIYVVKEKTYEIEGGSIIVYDNIIYKIVEQKTDKTIYSLKLWFMDDITKE